MNCVSNDNRSRPQKKQTHAIGCGFLLGTGLVILTLLTLNSIFVQIFFSVNLAGIDERFFQAAQFVLPIVMIFIEFWFYDWFTFYRRRWRK